jgi:hypothetical protein
MWICFSFKKRKGSEVRAKFAEITVEHDPHDFYPVVGQTWNSFKES